MWCRCNARQLSLEGTGEIKLRRLVKEALRMRPSRIMGLSDSAGQTSAGPVLVLVAAVRSGLNVLGN
jgi:pilus assembly protein CpaF